MTGERSPYGVGEDCVVSATLLQTADVSNDDFDDVDWTLLHDHEYSFTSCAMGCIISLASLEMNIAAKGAGSLWPSPSVFVHTSQRR